MPTIYPTYAAVFLFCVHVFVLGFRVFGVVFGVVGGFGESGESEHCFYRSGGGFRTNSLSNLLQCCNCLE